MVQFGKAIEEQRVAEWADGYVDYKALKETLSAMIANGLIQKFSEDTVYSPISVATSEAVLKPTGPGEHEFMAQLDGEIEKVNRFTERLHGGGRNIADLGDPMMTFGQGGLVIMKDGVILGGIGVGGYPSGQADEDISRIGLNAMNL